MYPFLISIALAPPVRNLQRCMAMAMTLYFVCTGVTGLYESFILSKEVLYNNGRDFWFSLGSPCTATMCLRRSDRDIWHMTHCFFWPRCFIAMCFFKFACLDSIFPQYGHGWLHPFLPWWIVLICFFKVLSFPSILLQYGQITGLCNWMFRCTWSICRFISLFLLNMPAQYGHAMPFVPWTSCMWVVRLVLVILQHGHGILFRLCRCVLSLCLAKVLFFMNRFPHSGHFSL